MPLPHRGGHFVRVHRPLEQQREYSEGEQALRVRAPGQINSPYPDIRIRIYAHGYPAATHELAKLLPGPGFLEQPYSLPFVTLQ